MSSTPPPPSRYHCGLCGLHFGEPAESHCGGCPLHRSTCGLVRCPRCGFEFPAGSRLLGWLQRRLRRSS